jgi:perosamine synthetase
MKLAISGGSPVRSEPFPAYVTVGKEERDAVSRVIDSGILSHYLGCCHEQFMGGPEVRALEEEWATYFGVKHAIAVNSCTSGLYCAVGAVGIEAGDECIVTPWTMCATATAPLIWGGIPVFADVEPDCFCLDAASVEARISTKTKAILAVDLFGQPYDADRINALALKHHIPVIEDCAQAPGAALNGKPTGLLGDIGVFSLNYHKHIHCGEGGIVVTNNDDYATRIRLIRNHAEAVVEDMGVTNIVNLVGFNFRMTELEAAVARCQLRKLSDLNQRRSDNVTWLEEKLRTLPFLTMPKVRDEGKHAYYVHACLYDDMIAEMPAETFVKAVSAELPPFRLREKEGSKLGVGYVKPLYRLPMFQKRIAFGTNHYPFSTAPERDYASVNCLVCEKLHAGHIITHEFMLPSLTTSDLTDVVDAFFKVWENRNELR